MAQQQQQPVVFLKPATWGSLKFAQTLKEKLFSGKSGNDSARVGKENEYVPSAAPPKVDLSHLQTLGPRRHVAQRYALQPNLSVSRQLSAPQPTNPGLLGLVPPGAQAQQQFHVKPLQIPQQEAPPQQRPSTPSSPTMRGRTPLGQTSNPNFVSSNIATRLPTPVRINSVPSPSAPSSSGNLAMVLPKPPSPSRSLSQGGVGGSPFAGAAATASPATSTATSTGFSIPVPPPVMPGIVRGPQQPPQRAAQPWAISSGGVPAARAHSSTATSRPSAAAPGTERSILASVQPRNASILTPSAVQQQQQQRGQHASTVLGVAPASASVTPDSAQQPQKKTAVAMPAAPQPLISVSSAITVPALQQALQQALLAAVEKKPETFKVDNFQQLFDSMMHPGHTGKLDGPLPDELADDVKYSDNWYKHCRDWNAKNKPTEAYSVPPPQPAPAEQPVPETPKSGLRPQWSLDEAPMSEACCRALDIAHHGLKKVLTPAHSSRSVSQAVGTPSVSRPAASSILAQRSDLLDDTAASRPAASATARPDATPTSSTAAQAADALAALAQASSPPQRAQMVATSPVTASAAGSTNASPVSAALAARALAASASAMALGTAICSTPERPSSALAAAAAALGIRTAAVMALVDGHETPVVPTAAKASIKDLLSPTPTRGGAGGPPSNVTTPGGPLTPGGACSTAAPSAAATPAQAGVSSTAATPTTDARRAQSASPACEVPDLAAVEARLAAAASCSAGLEQSLAAVAGVAGQEAGAAIKPPELSLAAAAPIDAPVAAVTAAEPELPKLAQLQAPQPVPTQEAVWSPNFPPVDAAASTSSRQYVPSPVTLMQNAPRDLPTPAIFNGVTSVPSGTGSLAAAVAVVAAPQHAASVAGVQMRDPAGPSTSTAPPAADPLNEITTGIQQLTALKHTILAEDKAVDVTGITQVLQLKMAVEQLLARTSTAAAAVNVASQAPVAPAAAAAAVAVAGAAHDAQQQQQVGTPQRKLSRSASFSAFIKGIFSPKSASKAAPQAVPASPSAGRAFGTAHAVNVATAAPASPALNVPGSGAVGVQPARPASASALPRHVASPSVTDRGRYAVLHQRAAARLAQAAAEPAAAAVHPPLQQRGDVWRRYEEKIASHRQQLDTTKSQLDEAVRKLHDMQAEFDELLLCLGMESAKNRALCDAMRAAGIDPEPIMAAIEAEWLAGNGEQ
ncbi:hypothetical protein HYH02_002364 [Chlamydomonas schloesseri]|uniref:Uncharacterized protein n=1 Tax=Chlamydomonas schloesseri TaxID=2026947 RepID=A0A835WRX0_9CHLO|nr:hypothetical protein HYH02_002364 [Chlamydomonas schloesseri]|eukprot:KAG2453029.1 hypothetical protein HYH02_002364 [Chlamydomonas schloesseri]